MINITKYKNKDENTVEYELEVSNENKIIFSTKVTLDLAANYTDKERDRIAKLYLMNMLLKDSTIEIFEELSNLIPVYISKEEYLRTQREFLI